MKQMNENMTLQQYLNDLISHSELISIDEEIKLTKEIRQGSLKALHKLVSANLRFVVSTAKKFKGQGLSLTDLISEGNLGLIRAAHRFDETKGFKFISYAVWWVRQAILQALSEQVRTVRLPLNKISEINTIRKFTNQYQIKHGEVPTLEQISINVNIHVEKIQAIIDQSKHELSLSDSSGDDDKNSLIDFIFNENQEPPDHNILTESRHEDIHQVLRTLSDRESDFIRLYYGINYERAFTLEEIGDKYGLTRERIRQIKEMAIKKLRHSSRSLVLRSYL